MALIELENISRVYKMGDSELKVLNGINLKIEAGEFVAIIGPSGSGKSTLMQIMGLLDRPTSGKYKLFGKDVSRLSDDDGARLRSRSIGFIFQMFNLLARTSARDNVMLPMIYSSAPDRDERAAELLKLMGLEERLDHKPNQLSGGQQQRVAIARALVNKPRLIFADEPTGNLASKQASEVLEMLKDFNRQGITVILVTHDDEIAANARRVIHIRDGMIVKDVTKKDEKTPEKPIAESAPPPPRSFMTELIEVRENLSSAVRALTSNKVRSGLSVLGITIGVAAVIAMMAIGRGAQKAIEARISSLGSNLVILQPQAPSSRGVRGGGDTFSRLTPDDVKAIQKASRKIKNAEGNVSGSVQVVYGASNWNVPLSGTMPAYQSMRNATPYYGRFFTEKENDRLERVALLGQSTVNNLFGNDDPIGKMIKINRINFKVIGVLPMKGATGFRDQDDTIVIPLSTAMKRVLGKRYLNSIDIESVDSDSIQQVIDDVTALMRARHRLQPQKENDFTLRNMADLQATLAGTTQTFTLLLAVVAAISLLVGGIGIMNIMLVSVSERTREIGLRKAVGATRRAVLLQFLIEAALLSMIGGGMGVMIGMSISFIMSTFAGWASDVTLSSVLLASIFSVSVGIVFGFWPARKASLLSPIEALRYE